MSYPAFRFATVDSIGVQWRLNKHSALDSAQLYKLYLGVCALSLCVSAWYWSQSAYWVSALVGLMLSGIALVMLRYLQHSGDTEQIFLQNGHLVVEYATGGKSQREVFDTAHVRVEPSLLDSSLIEVSGQGKWVQVGRYVRPEQRAALARELRQAVKAA